VVSHIFIFHNIWDNPSHWLSYFSRWLLHTNQFNIYYILVDLNLRYQDPDLPHTKYHQLSDPDRDSYDDPPPRRRPLQGRDDGWNHGNIGWEYHGINVGIKMELTWEYTLNMPFSRGWKNDNRLFLGVQNFETCAAKSGCKRCVRTATYRSLMLGAVLFFGAVGELAQRQNLLG